jgi:hypothetical protein
MNLVPLHRLLAILAGALALAAAMGSFSNAYAVPAEEDSSASVEAAEAATSESDTSMVLKGGEEGTVFKSLTVEGEDRVRIEFERPDLNFDLDAESAPGLDWESAREVIEGNRPDLITPFLQRSAYDRTPYMSRPWARRFVTGPVARFRPAVKGVERWRLAVADSRGKTVATFEGKGKPPDELTWDGKTPTGGLALPGLTYSYVLEAFDKAGNKRNFVGKGFQLPPYRRETRSGGLVMLFPGLELSSWVFQQNSTRAQVPSPLLLEAAAWVNQAADVETPIQVQATARTFEEASALADMVAGTLEGLVTGDPVRIQPQTEVQADAPERGVVAIRVSKKK